VVVDEDGVSEDNFWSKRNLKYCEEISYMFHYAHEKSDNNCVRTEPKPPHQADSAW
jgi:hypothetical protein